MEKKNPRIGRATLSSGNNLVKRTAAPAPIKVPNILIIDKKLVCPMVWLMVAKYAISAHSPLNLRNIGRPISVNAGAANIAPPRPVLMA